MADKKLNEVTKVTDMAYVPVIMADGSIGQIAKSDLASVVAGVIGFDSSVFKAKSFFEGKDANDIKDTGFYINGNTMSNVPAAYGLLMSNSVPGMVSQFYIEASSSSSFYVRNFSAGNWNQWQRIDNFGYNSLAELASGVGTSLGNPLASKGNISGDFNDAPSGIYCFHLGESPATNAPEGESIGMLICFNSPNSGNGGNPKFQIFATYGSYVHKVYFRSKWSSGWSNWQRVTLS